MSDTLRDRPFGEYPQKGKRVLMSCPKLNEDGYARASYEKGFSAVRVPWQAKNPELDHNLEGDFPNDSTLPDVAIGIKLSYKFPLEV